jgi:hypothetical protein
LKRLAPIEIPGVGRDTLAEWFREWGFSCIAEIGVEQGKYAEVICKANPEVFYHGVDPWEQYPGYRMDWNKEMIVGFHQIVKDRLAPYKNAQLHKGFSADIAKDFEDGSLDAVYIDANHSFESVIEDIEVWTPKVRKGGVVSGHDYRRHRSNCKVVEAVDWYVSEYKIKPWFLLGTKAQVSGQIRDTSRSWMWVRR